MFKKIKKDVDSTTIGVQGLLTYSEQVEGA